MSLEDQLDTEVRQAAEDSFSFDEMYREMASISTTSSWLASIFNDMGQYNPDDIEISTYKKMLDDEQVGAGIDIIRLAVLSTSWNINYTGTDERMQDEVIPFLEKQLNNVNSSMGGPKGINHVLWEMMLAIAYGNIPSEIVLKEPRDFDAPITLDKLKPIDPETIRRFEVDKHENLVGLTQSPITRGTTGTVLGHSGSGIFIDRKKLLLYSHNMSFQNWWGKSDFRRIYRSWFIKNFTIKFWNIAIEKYALPFTVGKTGDKTDSRALLQKIKMLQKTSAVVVEDDKTIDFLKGVVDRGAFEGAIEFHDRKLLTGLLVPPSQLESSTGAFAQSRTQQSTFMLRIKAIQNELEGVMEQLLKLLVDLNWKDVHGEYPTFNFEEPNIDDVIQMSNALNAAISAGYVDVETDFRWIRERLGFPEAEPEAMIERQPPPPMFGNMPSQQGGGPQQMPGPDATRRGMVKDPEIQPGMQDVTDIL